MTSFELAELIGEMIPHIVLLRDNEVKETITLDLYGDKYNYFMFRKPVPKLGELFQYCMDNSKDWCEMDISSGVIQKEIIQRQIAIKWFRLQEPAWNSFNIEQLIDFLELISNRTYENIPTVYNFIINKEEHGVEDIRLLCEKEGKILDIMASSNYAYIELDTELRIIKYDCVEIGDIDNKNDYYSVPDFLYPYQQLLKLNNGIAASVTHAGDIVVYSQDSLLFTKRKGNWTIYESAQLKNAFVDAIPDTDYGVKCNIFDLIWNLSYRRHGALIILSEEGLFENHIINKESILGRGASPLRSTLEKSIQNISIKNKNNVKKKALLMELLTMDGAVVISKNNGNVLSFGSIIETHKDVSAVSGARTTAGKSAIKHGDMSPIKISSDGDITLYCKVKKQKSADYKYLELKFY